MVDFVSFLLICLFLGQSDDKNQGGERGWDDSKGPRLHSDFRTTIVFSALSSETSLNKKKKSTKLFFPHHVKVWNPEKQRPEGQRVEFVRAELSHLISNYAARAERVLRDITVIKARSFNELTGP